MLKSRIADHRLQIVTLAFCVVFAAIAAAQESPTPTLSSTRGDGKDDGHQDSPSGRYHARGYLIGPLKRQDLGESSPPSTESEANVVKVRLVRNPLRKDKRPVVELAIGFDSEESYLKTSDGLPLFKVSETPNVTRAGIAAKGENAVDVWQDDGTSVHQYRISNVDQMMAFDCGDFELK